MIFEQTQGRTHHFGGIVITAFTDLAVNEFLEMVTK